MSYSASLARAEGYSLIRWLKSRAAASTGTGTGDKMVFGDQICASSLKQLERFVTVSVNALDLHESIESLNKYCFGTNTVNLRMTAGTAASDPDQVEDCHSKMQLLLDHISREVMIVGGHRIDEGFTQQEENELKKRLNVFGEVYNTRDLLFWEPSDVSRMEETMQVVNRFLEDMNKQDPNFLNGLSHDLRARAGGKLTPSSSCVSSTLPMCIRQDIIAPSTSQNAEECRVLQENNSDVFLNILNLIIDDIKSDRGVIERNLEDLNRIKPLILEASDVTDAMDIILSVWERVPDVKHSTRIGLLKVLKCLFMNASLEDRNVIFDRVTDHYRKEFDSKICDIPIPRFKNCFEDLEISLPAVMYKFGDHQAVQDDVEAFEEARDSLMWILLLEPLILMEVLKYCIENRAVVPGIVKALHCFPSLFSTVLPHESGMQLPIIIPMICGQFDKNVERFENKTYQDDFVYVIGSLAKRRRAVLKTRDDEGRLVSEISGEVIEDSLIESSDLLFNFILPNLFKEVTVHQKVVILQLLRRLLSMIGNKDVAFVWSDDLNLQFKRGLVSAPSLLILVYQMMINNEQKQQEIADAARGALAAMGKKLEDDDFIFEAETKAMILKQLTQDAWWIRYAVVCWFQHSLGSPKQQLPGGLYKALPEAIQEKCEEISVDFESDPVNCFLRSLFELALFDVKLAIDLLERGLGARLLNARLSEQIALALVDSYGRPFRTMRIAQLEPLFRRIFELLDPSEKAGYCIEYINDCAYHAFRNTSGIALVAKAAKLAYAKVLFSDSAMSSFYPTNSFDKPGDPAKTAEDLLQAFCELAKGYVDKQMNSLRGKRKAETSTTTAPSTSIQFSDEEQLLVEVSLLFTTAVQFTRLCGDSIPQPLKVLISSLSARLGELQRNETRGFLDDVVLEKVKEKTVYVYAQPICDVTDRPKEIPSPKTDQEKKHDVHSFNKATSCDVRNTNNAVTRRPSYGEECSSGPSSTSSRSYHQKQFRDSHSMHPKDRDHYRENQNLPKQGSSTHGGNGDNRGRFSGSNYNRSDYGGSGRFCDSSSEGYSFGGNSNQDRGSQNRKDYGNRNNNNNWMHNETGRLPGTGSSKYYQNAVSASGLIGNETVRQQSSNNFYDNGSNRGNRSNRNENRDPGSDRPFYENSDRGMNGQREQRGPSRNQGYDSNYSSGNRKGGGSYNDGRRRDNGNSSQQFRSSDHYNR